MLSLPSLLKGCLVILAFATFPAIAPPSIAKHLAWVREVNSMAQMPGPIYRREFFGPGGRRRATDWVLAEPGQPFRSTDVVGPGEEDLPYRRLMFAACDSTLCFVSYERGGIGYETIVLAIGQTTHGWAVVWGADTGLAVKTMMQLRTLVRGRGDPMGPDDAI